LPAPRRGDETIGYGFAEAPRRAGDLHADGGGAAEVRDDRISGRESVGEQETSVCGALAHAC
jgi:hypothetical protein